MNQFFEALLALLKSIPILNRWFTKTPSESQDDQEQETHEDMEKFKQTGRPPK